MVCPWSEITPYLFSLRSLPVNQMSFCSPLGEIVISDVHAKRCPACTGPKSESSRLLFISLWVWTQCKQLQTIILKVENADLGACTSQRLCFFDILNDIASFLKLSTSSCSGAPTHIIWRITTMARGGQQQARTYRITHTKQSRSPCVVTV